jgi:ribosomal protein L11 methyltransferase
VFEVRLQVGPGSADRARRLWEEQGALSVAETMGEVVAAFPDRAAAEAAAAAEGGAVRALDPDDLGYLDSWRAWAQPTRVGRLVVRPAWLPPAGTAGGGEIEVAIDPGHAFGHGGHPSTRLVLGALVERIGGGETVLDVGCGSGVLSVGAVALGAARVAAVDVDPAAVAVTHANAAANGMSSRIDARAGSLAAFAGSFDVVVANIGVVVLRHLAPALAGRLNPGGWLALSGLLTSQWPEVVTATSGLELSEVRSDEGWATPVLVRPS